MTTVKWAPWPNNKSYWVSTDGQIIGPSGKFLRTNARCSFGGYARVYCGGGRSKQKLEYVHRIVAQTFIDNPENKPQVNHINSDRSDNRAENLEWVWAKENAQHGAKKGHFRGAKSQYTLEDAENWAHQRKEGKSIRAIARELGVMHTTIRHIMIKHNVY